MATVLDDISARIANALVALDFDGTLSPIVEEPSKARPAPGTVETLNALAERGARVAIVTGRDALTLLELSGLRDVPGLRVYGLHGAEHWQAGQLVTRDEPPGITALRQELPTLTDQFEGVWIEDKRLSLVVHTRRAAQPELAYLGLRPVIRERARRHGLEAHDGKQVIEIRIPNLTKADAVAELLTLDPEAALFAGDDLGDLTAFDVVSEWGIKVGRPAATIGVGDEHAVQAAAQLHVASPAELVRTLAGLIR